VFTPEERARVRDALVSAARADPRVAAAALTGSSSTGREDRWSDVDLALGIEGDLCQAIADWTDRMYRAHGTIHHVDMTRGATVYRVFLLASTLQVDIAFAPAEELGPIASTFRLLFGTAREPRSEITWGPASGGHGRRLRRQWPPPAPLTPSAAELIGLGWLHALHARSCIARGRPWQAEYMIGRVRDHVLALACLRHDLPAIEGRGIDRLPRDVTAPIGGALVRSLAEAELRRAFRVANDALVHEIRLADRELASRLVEPVGELAS
jgi:hypothetical protein